MNHYCFEIGAHEDKCSCSCISCIKRNSDIKLEEFNTLLSEKRKLLMSDVLVAVNREKQKLKDKKT